MTLTNTQLKPQIALIDGDIFRYEIGAIETDHPFVDGLKIPGDIQLIQKILDERINGILTAVGCEDYAVFTTGKGNFRDSVAVTEPYKGHREGKEKPFHWGTVDEHLRTKWLSIEVSGMEADDVLALSQRAYAETGTPSVICSRDKDLRMVPGFHYSWACGEHQKEKPLYYISELEATKFFWCQMLTGDWGTDHIPGCAKIVDAIWKTGAKAGESYRKRQGIGPVQAEKLLSVAETEQDMYNIVKQSYQDIFGEQWSQMMLEQGRLLYIGQTPTTLWELPTWTN